MIRSKWPITYEVPENEKDKGKGFGQWDSVRSTTTNRKLTLFLS